MAFQPAADDTLVLSTSTQPLLRVAVPLTPDAAYVSFIYGSVPPLSEFFGNVLEGTQSQGAPGFSIYPNGDMAGFGQPGFSIDPLAHRITFDLAQVRTLAPFRFGFTTDLVNFGLSASSPGAFITVSDFHVIPSPEPTTVGLLLCGSVFCFGRRTLREHDRNA